MKDVSNIRSPSFLLDSKCEENLVVFLKTESPTVVVVKHFEKGLSKHPVLQHNLVSNLLAT